MRSVRIVTATYDHAREAAEAMRDADAAELLAATGLSPLDGLERALDVSERAWAGLIDGDVAALWGVQPVTLVGQAAYVWCLTTTVVDRFPLTFAKASIQAMRDLRDDYPVLIGDVDDRYGASCRWLAWLGGSVGAPRAAGPLAQPFRQFSFGRA